MREPPPLKLRAILHRISHLKWLLLIVEVGLIAYCFLVQPEDLMPLVGLTIFIAGIQLGLDSLSDHTLMSNQAKLRYTKGRYATHQARFLLGGIIVLTLISVLFVSLRWFPTERNADLFRDFFDVGIDCLALILGMLCTLKSVRDKEEYAIANQP